MKKLLKIYTLILIGLVFCTTSSAFSREASGSVFAEAKKMMREGRFNEAGKLIAASVNQGEDKARAEGFLAVTTYSRPDWDPEDLTELEKTEKYSIPLLADIAAQDPPAEAGRDQAEWIINTRIKFIAAIGKMKYVKAIPALIKLGDSKDARIRLIAVKALAAMGTSEANKGIFDYLLTEHLPDYKSGNLNQQMALENQTRTIAIGVLAQAGDPSLETELVKKVKERKSADRLTAAIILTGYRSSRFQNIYLDLLKEDDPALKLYAAAALREMGDNEGFAGLKKLFESSDPGKQIAIISAIGSWGDKESIKFLIDFLDKQSSGKKMGYVPINLLGKAPDTSRTDLQTYLYARLVQIMTENHTASAPLLLEILKSGKNNNMSYFAAEILGECRYKPAKEILVKNLDSKDPLTVYYAVFALGRMKDKADSEKIKALLSSTVPQISAAAAWSLACVGDDSGRQIALKNLGSKDPALSSAALDTLCMLRVPSDAAVVSAAAKKGFMLHSDFITAFKLIGITGDINQMDILKTGAAENLPVSFYAAEAMFRITGMPALYGTKNETPEDSWMYGAGIYDINTYARYYLLYMTLDPGMFGKLNEVRYGYVTPLRRFGEFGRVEDKSPANPIMAESGADQTGKPAGELQPGQSVIVRKTAGNRALVSLNDGNSGWTMLAGLDITDKVISYTSQRLKKDTGFRQKNDLEQVLKNDYIGKTSFIVERTAPKSSANAEMAMFALDMGERFSGSVSLDSGIWDEIIKGIDTGKRIVTADGTIKNEKWIFTFDAAGNLESIKK
ncbi:MAG: HEAT repeat domain-containing protein [Firmicutes bacterium]|nr:HEAT repeat domain-containing protein [Bacillota bacterium]